MTLCASCTTPLILPLDPEQTSSSAPSTVPDDVTLCCACHFHWQCLVDDYSGAGICPHCGSDITAPNASTASSSTSASNIYQHEPSILVTLHNEGGLQQNLDIQPLLREEVYLKTHPAEQRARAFLEFVRERDDDAIVQLLRDAAEGGAGDDDPMEDDSEDEDEDITQLPLSALLRYQDPLDSQRSALHIAVMAGNTTVVWLLLLLASSLLPEAFPENVKQTAMQMGFVRESQDGLPDIRGLRDTAGRTAWDLLSNGEIERELPGFEAELLIP